MCIFRHKKRFVAIRDFGFSSQMARWVCERCGRMGSKYIDCNGVVGRNGVWAVENGKLVPDLKRWEKFERS